jgi:hypothetical protein
MEGEELARVRALMPRCHPTRKLRRPKNGAAWVIEDHSATAERRGEVAGKLYCNDCYEKYRSR